MSEIRPLTLEEIDGFTAIIVNAYPGMDLGTPEAQEQFKKRTALYLQEDTYRHFVGLFRQGRMAGVMIMYDFVMNMFGTRLPAGGVGMVAVDLPYKKEHVAKEMIRYYLRYYRENDTPLALLYPFRPDFYKKMGFGYGTKVNQYRLRPAALPKGPSKAHVRYLTADDEQALASCYARFVAQHHGMIERPANVYPRMLARLQNRIVGYEVDGHLEGYLIFSFEKGESFIVNDLHVNELIYESHATLSELLTFLHTQDDQIRHVVFETQDESFHFLPLDPRNKPGTLIPAVNHETNLQGLGLMYRVLDVTGILGTLADRDWNGQSLRLKLTITDSFLPENEGDYLLCFEDGRLHLEDDGPHDAGVELDVAEFSSLLMGTVNFTSLYRYGLTRISNEGYVKIVERALAVENKPICMTQF